VVENGGGAEEEEEEKHLSNSEERGRRFFFLGATARCRLLTPISPCCCTPAARRRRRRRGGYHARYHGRHRVTGIFLEALLARAVRLVAGKQSAEVTAADYIDSYAEAVAAHTKGGRGQGGGRWRRRRRRRRRADALRLLNSRVQSVQHPTPPLPSCRE